MSPLPQTPHNGDEEFVQKSVKSGLSIKPPSNISGLVQPPRFSKPSLSKNPPVEPVIEELDTVDIPAFSTEEVERETTPAVQQVTEPARAEPTPTIQTVPAPVEAEKFENDSDDLTAEELEDQRRRALIDSLSQEAKQNARRLIERIMDDKCSEVLMNGPNKIMVKENGNRFHLNDIKFDSIEEYHTVIDTLILAETDTKERIRDGNSSLIEGQLELADYENEGAPSLFARVHVLTPPAVKTAIVTIAKKAKKQFRIDDLVNKTAMSPPMGAFLKALSRGKATIVFSGLSGAGKTTLLEAASYEFDENDRIVVIEDTAELNLPVYDVVSLLATSKKPGQKVTEIVTMEWLVAQANRMRPDRIIVGESRGGEFAEFLTAANSGADGSMTTLHASGTRQAIDKMRNLAMKATTGSKDPKTVISDIASTVQVIVQMSLIDGRHVITQIDEVSDVVTANGTVSIQPIFLFDRSMNRFKAIGKPSEKLTSFLAGRGVTVDLSWFQRI
jgi:pilus assembly protein CpaF